MAVRLGMKSLATTPFVDPNTRRRTDRSIAQVTKDQRQASFTLGVSPTSVLELANVGATLASAGRWCPPCPIESVTDQNGKPVPVKEAACEQAVEPGLANTLLTGLSKDVVSGTAAGAARQVGWDRPMAGKTGTTQQHKSAAFVGVVPQMAGAVITFDDSNAPRPLCDGAGSPFACGNGNIFGGKTPAQTWFAAMKPLLDGQPVLPLPPTDLRYLDGAPVAQIPNVVGRPLNEARAILQRAGRATSAETTDNERRTRHRRGAEPAGAGAARRDRAADREQRQRTRGPAGARRRSGQRQLEESGRAASAGSKDLHAKRHQRDDDDQCDDREKILIDTGYRATQQEPGDHQPDAPQQPTQDLPQREPPSRHAQRACDRVQHRPDDRDEPGQHDGAAVAVAVEQMTGTNHRLADLRAPGPVGQRGPHLVEFRWRSS